MSWYMSKYSFVLNKAHTNI